MHNTFETPRVSIITPAYNAEAHLAETVESVLAQSMADFEMVIVDDGSSDGTLDVAHTYARRDRRIRVFRQSNSGVCLTRNTALGHSRGSIIALLDSDDVWMADYLAVQLALFEQIPTASIITVNAIQRGGPQDGRPLWPIDPLPKRLDLLDIIEKEDSVCIMSCVRRAVVDHVGGFDPRFQGNEDYHFWLRATNAGFELWRNGVPGCFYRRRPTSLSSDERRMLKGIIGVLREGAVWRADRLLVSAAIEKQIKQSEERLLVVEITSALEAADYGRAAEHLQNLRRLKGGALLAAVSAVSRVCPGALGVAAKLRAAFRGQGKLGAFESSN